MRDLPSSRDIASAAFHAVSFGVVSAFGSGGGWGYCGGSSADGIVLARNQNVGKYEVEFRSANHCAGISPHERRGIHLRGSRSGPQDVSSENGEGAPRGCSSSPTPFAMNE